MDTQVTVIGAGPVGLTLAMDLAQRGIDVVVVESRSEDDPADAKCNTVAARTMEVFRQLGVADAVRAAGLSDDFPTDVLYCTSVAGEEIARIIQPSRNERLARDTRSAPGYLDSHWPTPEPVVRVSQLYLNPILFRHARTFERITLLPDTKFLSHEDASYEDVGGRVVATCQSKAGESVTINSRYLIGCDGGSSSVRSQMGIRLVGDAEISRARTSLVRSRAIKDLFPGKPAWMAWALNPRTTGTVVAIDGEELWLIHRTFSTSREFESVDRDQSIRDVLGVGQDFTWEVVHHQDWTARRLIAERFRVDNVFLCGDAAHIWIPFAGYGMNAGIADGMNLSWLLAAVLNGQADERILEAHERERHPITEQVSKLAMGKALEYMERAQQRAIPKMIEKRHLIGRILRYRIGKQLYDINAPQFACEGLNFGYYYDDSPIIQYDGSPAPSYEMGSHTPSSVPGCRMPHFWIDDDTSLYDALGNGYTLVSFDAAIAPDAFVEAARRRGFPLDVLNCKVPDHSEWLQTKLILVRPDRHVAWRGDALPDDLDVLLDRLSGKFNSSPG